MKLLVLFLGVMLFEAKAQWRLLQSPPVDSLARNPVLSLASHSGSLFAGTKYGLFRSTDGGLAWEAVKAPYLRGDISYLGSAGGNLYCTQIYGDFRSVDQGRTWTPVSSLVSTRIRGDSTVLVTGYDEDELATSYDNGRTWEPLQWTPYNREISAFLDSDSLLLVGTERGAYSSSDHGNTWKPWIGEWSKDDPVAGVRMLFQKGDNFFVGASLSWNNQDINGLFVSADRGRTWRDITPKPAEAKNDISFAGFSIYSLEIFDGRWFAAVRDPTDRVAYPNGIYLSEDSGKTWMPRNLGLPTYREPGTGKVLLEFVSSIRSLGEVLLAVTVQGVYRSTDYGKSWVSANVGIPSSPGNAYDREALRVTEDELNLTIFVTAQYKDFHYRSSDTGQTWKLASRAREGILDQRSGAGKSFALFRDRLLVSGNAGASWTPIHGPWERSDSEAIELERMSVSGSRVYLATLIGSKPRLYFSEDGGASWKTHSALEIWRCQARIGSLPFQAIGSELALSRDSGRTWTPAPPTHFPWDITALESAGNLLLALSGDSLRFSRDQGATWHVPTGPISSVYVYGLMREGDRFLANTSGGLFVSRDGTDWKPLEEKGMTLLGITAMAAANENLVALNGKGLFYSRDHGGQWAHSDSAPPGAHALAAQNGIFYAGTAALGVWASFDSGKTWKAANPRNPYGGPVTAMAAGPSALYVIQNGNLLRSEDKGMTWSRGILPEVSPQALAYADGRLWTLASDKASDGSLWVSADEGTTWQKQDAPGAGALSLLSGQGAFLAAGSLDGIFFPSASKAPWLPQGNGLPSKNLSSLLVSEGRLYAGLFDQGLWEMTLPTAPVSIGVPAKATTTNSLSLGRALGTRSFRFQLTEPASVQVSVYSIAGKRLANLAARNFGSGTEQLEWSGGAREGTSYLYVAEAHSLLHPEKRIHVQRGLLPP